MPFCQAVVQLGFTRFWSEAYNLYDHLDPSQWVQRALLIWEFANMVVAFSWRLRDTRKTNRTDSYLKKKQFKSVLATGQMSKTRPWSPFEAVLLGGPPNENGWVSFSFPLKQTKTGFQLQTKDESDPLVPARTPVPCRT